MKRVLLALGLIALSLSGCARSPQGNLSASESVVGNGGNELALSFLSFVRHDARVFPERAYRRPTEKANQNALAQWLSEGEILVLVVNDLPGDQTETTAYHASIGSFVLHIRESYWKNILEGLTEFPPEEALRVRGVLTELAMQNHVIPRRAQLTPPRSKASLIPDFSRPQILDTKAAAFTKQELEDAIHDELLKTLMPQLENQSIIFPSTDLNELIRFLKHREFRLVAVDGPLHDNWGQPVSARIVKRNDDWVCEMDMNRWATFFSPNGRMNVAKVPHLFHEVLRFAKFTGLISANDDFYRYSSQLPIGETPLANCHRIETLSL